MSTPDKSRAPFRAALAIVIGNMIGTGVFASLGFQAGGLPSGFAIAMLWTVGGLLALCGAVNYAALTQAFPGSGGEYRLLSRMYHPGAGFVSGWVSMLGGFPAPIAVNAILIGKYGTAIFGVEDEVLPRLVAAAVVVGMTLAHLVSVRFSGRLQWVATLLKVLLVLAFAVCGFLLPEGRGVTFLPQAGDGRLLLSAAFFGNLIFVLYGYSGWNAACYVAGEIEDAPRNVPRALVIGTLLVTALYVAVNAAMYYATPLDVLKKSGDEAAFFAAEHIFGKTGGAVIAGLIGFGLLSTISAMMWAGPRVMQQMGRDHPRMLGFLGRTTAEGVPATAVVLQGVIALVLVFLWNARDLIERCTFLLEMMTLLTVFGVIHLRFLAPERVKVRPWGYPWTTLFYLAIVGWTISRLPREVVVFGLGLLAIGIVLYFIVREPGGVKRDES